MFQKIKTRRGAGCLEDPTNEPMRVCWLLPLRPADPRGAFLPLSSRTPISSARRRRRRRRRLWLGLSLSVVLGPLHA